MRTACWWLLSSGNGAVVDVGSPGVGASAVGGEVGDRVAELFVGPPAESDVDDFAGLAGGGRDSGQAGQRFWGGELRSAVSDLAEQAGGAYGARPRQRGEDLRVGVAGELVGDVGVEGVDLSVEAFQYGHEGASGGGGVGSGGAAWCAGEPAVQHRRVGAAAVADAGQPAGQACDRKPVGAVLAVETGQKCQADRRVEGGEQADRAGEHDHQVRAQLVGYRDPVGDEVFAGAAGLAQGGRGSGVGQQRVQPRAVGAQGIGEHERVEPVVFVAGRAVAAAQVLDLVGADHHDGDTGVEQGVDHRPVGAFDRDLTHAGTVEYGEQLAQSGGVVFDRGSHDFTAAVDRRPTPRDHRGPSRFRR